jgi:hypothetical protein
MTVYINATPHDITVNDVTYAKTEYLARVKSSYTAIIDGECKVEYGEVEGLPEPMEGFKFIVSSMVLDNSTRTDLVSPATGHPNTIRNDRGHIISVPCFITK